MGFLEGCEVIARHYHELSTMGGEDKEGLSTALAACRIGC